MSAVVSEGMSGASPAEPAEAGGPVAPAEPRHALTEFVNVPNRINRLGMRVWTEALADLVASREVLWRLTWREISARYRQSLLGLGWSVITPLAMAAVFVFLNSADLVRVGETDLPYPLFVMLGLIPWQMFAACLTRGANSLVSSAHLLQRVRCSREVLVLSSMGGAAFDFLVGLALIAGFLLWFGVAPAWTVMLLPLLVAVQLALSTAMALTLSVLNAAVRDVGSAVPLLINVWLFLTPILYPPAPSGVRAVLNWVNPMAPLVVSYRDLIVRGELTMPAELCAGCALTFVLLAAGWRFFHSMLPHVAEKA